MIEGLNRGLSPVQMDILELLESGAVLQRCNGIYPYPTLNATALDLRRNVEPDASVGCATLLAYDIGG
jgi:hypothetical protein